MMHESRRSNYILNFDEETVSILFQKKRLNKTPLVTVAISLYNYEAYIIDCLESVKSQTIDLDLIIVDDCSQDDSVAIVRNWLSQNEDIFEYWMLVQHKQNMGLACARNTGFQLSRTKYIFVLDADNLIYPCCLEKLVNALENCQASFAYSYLEKFGAVSCLQNTKPWDINSLQYGNRIDAMVLHRKDVWNKIGGYTVDEVMRLGWEDFELWFKIAKIQGWGILVPEILARYRVHCDSMLHTKTNPNVEKLWNYIRMKYPELF
jgi:glycosyltransferase involved in cell wall biosynthesis